MLKKIISIIAATAALVTSCFAITPDTISVYEKIDQIQLVELSGSNLTMVYWVVGAVCLLMVLFYIWDRRKKKAAAEYLDQQENENQK